MPQKNPQCSAMDQSESDLPSSCCHTEHPTGLPVGGRKKEDSGQRKGETSSSSPESGSLNGETKCSGKSRRRRKRGSNSECRPERSADGSGLREEEEPHQAAPQPTARSALLALQSEYAAVWLQCGVYEQAESRYRCWLACSSAGATQPTSRSSETLLPSVPNTLELPAPPNPPITPVTPDEGYHSQAPTPAAPIQPSVTPPVHQPINGLPRLPVELLRDVWLEKPVYDRAEATFYQNLSSNNCCKRLSSLSTCRSAERPQRLVEEEEEDASVEEKTALPQGKAEVFHALHPIQEEEEPAEESPAAGVSFCLHPDSERVWVDRSRYDAAESCFYRHCVCTAGTPEGAPGPAAGCPGPWRDKYGTMTAVDFLAREKIWFEKPQYDKAERHFYERVHGPSQPAQDVGANSILQDIARARENIQKSLAGLKSTLCNSRPVQLPLSHQSHFGSSSGTGDQEDLVSRMKSLELENQSLHRVVGDLRAALSKLECRVSVLEKCPAVVTLAPAHAMPCTNGNASQPQKSALATAEEGEEEEDFDLFGSDEDDPEAERMKEERLKEYAEKKAKKPSIIAKSSILLDVKPWDDETDMVKLEECVRSIQADGLLWGTSKLVPVGYGIHKLQIACVVEDDKVGTDMLEEEITGFDHYVQSVDVAAFNKI